MVELMLGRGDAPALTLGKIFRTASFRAMVVAVLVVVLVLEASMNFEDHHGKKDECRCALDATPPLV